MLREESLPRKGCGITVLALIFPVDASPAKEILPDVCQIDLERQRGSFRIENTLEDHTPARDASGKVEYAPFKILRLPINAQCRVQGLRLKILEKILGVICIHTVQGLREATLPIYSLFTRRHRRPSSSRSAATSSLNSMCVQASSFSNFDVADESLSTSQVSNTAWIFNAFNLRISIS